MSGYVALVENPSGSVSAVQFKTHEAAEAWIDDNNLLDHGIVPLDTRKDALR